MGKAIRESYFRKRLEKFQIGNAYSLTEKGLFWSVYVDFSKLAGKKQNIDPMWKIVMKGVDFGEPTSFLDHVYFGCTQRECQTSKDVVDNCRKNVRIQNLCWSFLTPK